MQAHYNDRSVFFTEATPVNGTVTVEALLFYEGIQTDSAGNKREYTAGRLGEIVENTNSRLKQGDRIPLFKDHKYIQDSVIGQLLEVYAKPIDSLPMEGLERLNGLAGIYGKVLISGEENITRYSDGRFKTLSVGIDLNKGVIYEVSVVPFPAVPGASLFTDGATHALTLDKTAEERKSPFLYFDLFMQIIGSIDGSSETNKDVLKQQAIADLGDKLREVFGLSVPTPTIPLFSMEEKDMETTAQYEARIKELEAQQAKYAEMQDKLAQLERVNEVTAKFTELKDRAVALRDAGKLLPAAYKEYFGEPKQAIAIYSALPTDGGKDIEQVEGIIAFLEKFGAPVVEFGRKTPLENLEEIQGEDLDTEAKRIIDATSKYGMVY